MKDFTYNFGRNVGIIALSYFADRNDVGNNKYEGLIGRIYQKLQCKHSLTYL